MIIMGTGSRSLKTDPQRYAVKDRLLEYMGELRETHNNLVTNLVLISGLAEGWDELIALCAIELDIPYIAMVPNRGYGEYYWQDHSVTGTNRMSWFNHYLSHAADVRYICTGIYQGGEHSNFVRNRVMVNHANEALVYDAGSSGTKHAVGLLSAADKPMHVYPFT